MVLRIFPLFRWASLAASALLLAGCEGHWPRGTDHVTRAPESFALQGKAMAASADPRATDAALAMLAKGGSATDATIAAMAVLGLVEPQSAGLGGGGFWLAYDRKTAKVTFLDGRETAPRGARPDMLLENGKELDFFETISSGHVVGTPGLVALFAEAHRRSGKLPWAELFAPAIRLAEEGFALTSRTSDLAGRLAPRTMLYENPPTRAYLFDETGKVKPAGTMVRNPDYAATLRAIARDGPKAFYEGALAREIAAAAQAGPRGGSLAIGDLAAYKVTERAPACGPFRKYWVCSSPAPGSGQTVVQILGLYERAVPVPEPAASAKAWSAFIEASRAGYADRDHFVADPSFVPVPEVELIDADYLDARAKIVAPAAPPARIQAGDHHAVLGHGVKLDQWGADSPDQSSGTTHLTVIDANGDSVALTATIEAPFGSYRWAGGFFLNNEMTDFARIPTKNGKPVANAAEALKTPRSSMSPSMVFTSPARTELVMSAGSPGGNSIVAYVAKTLIGVLDMELSAQAAVALPNIVARGDQPRIEASRAERSLIDALKVPGRDLREVQGEESGLHVIVARGDHYEGAADPRRLGTAREITVAPK